MDHLNQLIVNIFDFNQFVIFLNIIPIEITWIVFLFLCLSIIMILLKIFGEIGLYIYTIVAIIVANIQVLKIVKFSFFSDPVALGTILFASTFLCTDILSEYYSKEKAKKNVLIGFTGFLLMTFMMLFTLGFKPLEGDFIINEYFWITEVEKSLKNVFLPLPTFFVASMIAYLSSQYFDVWFFSFISKITKNKFLWFRNNLSTMTSSLLDNIIFSIFAFIILSKEPLALNIVIFTYILGTFILRIFISLIDTPFVYLAKYIIKK